MAHGGFGAVSAAAAEGCGLHPIFLAWTYCSLQLWSVVDEVGGSLRNSSVVMMSQCAPCFSLFLSPVDPARLKH